MRRFVCILVAIGCVFFNIQPVIADTPEAGDEYSVDSNYPSKHWVFMTQEEEAHFAAEGWQQNVGVLWYDSNDSVVDFLDVTGLEEIQDAYNKGCTFHVIYTWLCDGSLLGKNTEQSVTVGHWIMPPQKVLEYYQTFSVPNLPTLEEEEYSCYSSSWCYDGKYSSEPVEGDPLDKYTFEREVWMFYQLPEGRIYLKEGSFQRYDYSSAMECAEEIEDSVEIPKWK